MAKRIFAWVLLAGFVLLIANILYFGFYRKQSFIVYLALVGVFLAVNMRSKKK